MRFHCHAAPVAEPEWEYSVIGSACRPRMLANVAAERSSQHAFSWTAGLGEGLVSGMRRSGSFWSGFAAGDWSRNK